MNMIVEIAIAALLVIGGFFGLIGSYGMLRLRNQIGRAHV